MALHDVLIVDDETEFRGLLKEILESAGFSVVEAENGKEAQTLLTTKKFDAIISDIRMPIVNGIELLKFAKASFQIPFILMTGFSEILETHSAHSLGADDFIAKPFKPQELLSMLNKCLESKQRKEEKNLDHDYYRIDIESCGSGKLIASDVYIKLSSFKYLKIAHKDTQIDTSRIAMYKQRGVDFLYIRLEDYTEADDSKEKLNPDQIQRKIKWE